MEFNQKPFAFQAMAKPIGSACNLNCTYCYYLEKSKLYRGSSNHKMSDELLERFVKQYIQVQEVPVIQFVWQGGEPTLMGLDFYKKAVELQKKYANGKKIENSFQTNGTLINDEWCHFFKQNNFLIGISIDGPEKIHNLHRIFNTGKPSFADVMKGIDFLRKHKVDFNTLTVVHRHNSRFPIDIYRFLKEIGSTYLQFIPIIERKRTNSSDTGLNLMLPQELDGEVTDWSVIPEDYAYFLIKIFNEWVRKDVGKYFVLQFDATLANWVGESSGICVFSETCGDAVVLEHNGDVYSCDHFVYPVYKLGNINEKTFFGLMKSEEQFQFSRKKLYSLPQQCLSCEYRFACHGECPKHRFINTTDGEPGLNYLCPAYKKFFAHVHPFMQFMAEELNHKHPPSNVMEWAKKIIV
jgi:uncharacterized protein